tara:strand:+ start:1915 stop:2193 length:279 start_codon:yes stop_codon:yes gene_type:complete
MFSCVFCEEEWVYTTNLCENCRRLKHLKKIYRERFNETLERVLVRNIAGMDNKIEDLKLKNGIEQTDESYLKKPNTRSKKSPFNDNNILEKN